MRNRAQIARVGLRRKNFMRDVGGKVKDAAVGVVNENKRRCGVFHYRLGETAARGFHQLIFALFLFRISKDYYDNCKLKPAENPPTVTVN